MTPTRIYRRRYGHEEDSLHAIGATHKIAIGFDKRKPDADRPFPGKYRGFVIYRDTVGADKKRVVDHDCMRRLMPKWAEKNLGLAQAAELNEKAAGLLPLLLHFILPFDALRGDDSDVYTYPGMFAESYEYWTGAGLACHGNGIHAQRRANDGTREEIDCVPAGATGAEAKEFCKFSTGENKNRVCRSHSRLVVCLVLSVKGAVQPLCESYGHGARFRFDTSSEFSAAQVLESLDDAARRLDGNVGGLPGTLTFSPKNRRLGNEDGQRVGVVGQVQFTLNAAAISQREQDLRRARTLHLGQREQLLLAEDGAEDLEQTPALVIEPEPDPEPEPEPVAPPQRTVSAATDAELADSLKIYLEETGRPLGEIAFFDYASTKETDEHGNPVRKVCRIPGIDWFFDGEPGQSDELRRTELRKACLGLEGDPDCAFDLIPAAEEVAP